MEIEFFVSLKDASQFSTFHENKSKHDTLRERYLFIYLFCKIFAAILQSFDLKYHGQTFLKIAFVTAWKVSKYGVFSGPHFPAFGLITEIYSAHLRI